MVYTVLCSGSLLGAKDDVVAAAAPKVQALYPKLKIAGYHHCYFWDDEAAIVFVGFVAIFSGFRVAQEYDLVSFFKNIDFKYIAEHKYLIPFFPVLSMFDFSQNTIATIGNSLRGHMYDGLFLSNYETFLPGQHWGARNIIGEFTGARWVAG